MYSAADMYGLCLPLKWPDYLFTLEYRSTIMIATVAELQLLTAIPEACQC